MTDFRRELTFREKKVAEIKREKMRMLADVKPVPKYMISVDLSHARGNLDAVRLCLKELEWKEVSTVYLATKTPDDKILDPSISKAFADDKLRLSKRQNFRRPN